MSVDTDWVGADRYSRLLGRKLNWALETLQIFHMIRTLIPPLPNFRDHDKLTTTMENIIRQHYVVCLAH